MSLVGGWPKKKNTQMAVVRQQTHRKHLLKSLIITSLADI